MVRVQGAYKGGKPGHLRPEGAREGTQAVQEGPVVSREQRHCLRSIEEQGRNPLTSLFSPSDFLPWPHIG